MTRAGTGAASNLIRGLRRGLPDLRVVGCHDDPFVLKKSTADTSYLVPLPDHQNYERSMSWVIEREAIDLVIPTTDADVAAMARLRPRIPARVFLPKTRTLAICYDKLGLAQRLMALRVPVAPSYPVSSLDSLEPVFARLQKDGRAWCRARRGAGSLAAAPVASADEARAWIGLWCAARGVEPSAFMLAEYLPGRDFACQSLWRGGDLVLIKTTERLAYVDGSARLSGTSSVASVHKTIRDDRLVAVVIQAVLAVDKRASGAFSVDLKENADGRPCVTEINAGRLLSGTPIFDEVGRHNMSATYVRLGIGRPVKASDVYDSQDGYYMTRDLDTLPHVFDTDGFWRGWIDARAPEQVGLNISLG